MSQTAALCQVQVSNGIRGRSKRRRSLRHPRPPSRPQLGIRISGLAHGGSQGATATVVLPLIPVASMICPEIV
jgi:hypothetical protein